MQYEYNRQTQRTLLLLYHLKNGSKHSLQVMRCGDANCVTFKCRLQNHFCCYLVHVSCYSKSPCR